MLLEPPRRELTGTVLPVRSGLVVVVLRHIHGKVRLVSHLPHTTTHGIAIQVRSLDVARTSLPSARCFSRWYHATSALFICHRNARTVGIERRWKGAGVVRTYVRLGADNCAN